MGVAEIWSIVGHLMFDVSRYGKGLCERENKIPLFSSCKGNSSSS